MKKRRLILFFGVLCALTFFATLNGVFAESTPSSATIADQVTWTNQFVTVQPKAVIFASLSPQQVSKADLTGQTFQVSASQTTGQQIFLTLKRSDGTTVGLVNANQVALADSAAGVAQAATGYASLTNLAAVITQTPGGTVVGKASQYALQTFKITAVYHHFNGKTYDELTRSDGTVLGYVEAGDVATRDVPQGAFQALNNYGKASGDAVVYRDFSAKAVGVLKSYSEDYVNIAGQYHHFNGKAYYSIYGLNGKWIGYVQQDQIARIDGENDSKVADHRYVTVQSKAYGTYQGFTGQQLNAPGTLVNHTYRSTAKYLSNSGVLYLELVDNQGNPKGIINAKAVAPSNNPQGQFFKTSQYTTFTDKTVGAYADFSTAQLKHSGSALYHHTYRIAGIYYHFNGSRYFSLYDGSKWLGYVKADKLRSTPNKQGLFVPINLYITTKSKGKYFWSSFTSGKGKSTTNYYQQTFAVKGQYFTYRGANYYSSYRYGNHWMGYINSSLVAHAEGNQGAAMSTDKTLQVTSKSYAVYRSFAGVKASLSGRSVYGKVYHAKVKYRTYSGTLYYSLYSGKKWVGYINARALAETYRVINVPNYRQYPLGIPVGCEGVSLYQALRAKGRLGGYSVIDFLHRIPKASSPYRGFVGSPFNASGYLYNAIFASPLTKWGAKYGNVTNISGASVNTLMNQVLAGNPVVVYVTIHFAAPQWATWSFGRVPNNNHAVTLAGVDKVKKRLYVSDPIDGKYWISISKFSKIYNTRKMAVLVR